MIPKEFKQIILNGSNRNEYLEESYNKFFMCKICETWYLGKFTKEWYGLNFNYFTRCNVPLDFIQEVYEVIFS